MNTLKEVNHWPDEVRLKMIEKSEFYKDPSIYQFGYYDGYQDAMKELVKIIGEAWTASFDYSEAHKNFDNCQIGTNELKLYPDKETYINNLFKK